MHQVSNDIGCNVCGGTRVLVTLKKADEIDLVQAQRIYEESNSFRYTGRTFEVSHTTVQRGF